ncbi:mechanosensitive ion channel family protein [Achromobacter sp. DH1f]|uniref:mechanosensitive ion channel domain-containing protein n=1 Tax=Achromobacter sp. DH1f TaxID=1397275 RepID=UPI0009DD2DF6|nr:mechanosensitive ion channel family protein [Achromobacter sp. DH1f]
MSYVFGNVVLALSPHSALGALLIGALILSVVIFVVLLIRRSAKHVALHLSDTTALQFISEFAQLLVFVLGFILYAHLIPELRSLGTALLTGVSVVSVVVGMAAQTTLGNIIAGFSLVLYRQVRVGDTIQLNSPLGVVTAKVEIISLGFTQLINSDGHDLVVPNSVMMANTIIRINRGQ